MKKQTHLKPKQLFSLGLLSMGLSSAYAAVVVVAPTSSTLGSVAVTSDITLTITRTGNAYRFVLDEWVTSDGNRTLAFFTPVLSLSINGAPPANPNTGQFIDNAASTTNDVTQNDGYFSSPNPFAVSVGDTVILKAASYGLGAISGFNPQATKTFTGNMFITDADGIKFSNTVSASVPEPSSWAALLVGGIAILAHASYRRQRTVVLK